jgi:hypothetical protein
MDRFLPAYGRAFKEFSRRFAVLRAAHPNTTDAAPG